MSNHGLRWPTGWQRTPASRRENGDRFNYQDPYTRYRVPITIRRAEARLREELRKLGARRVEISTDSYGDDPAVAVYFILEGKPLVMARDRFDTMAANMRSLGLAIEAIRQLERHGGAAMMDRAMTGFAALPPPRSCWDILGVDPDADLEEIERAFRAKALKHHPDRGGSNKAMAELNDARDQALRSSA